MDRCHGREEVPSDDRDLLGTNTVKTLFENWDAGTVLAEVKARKFIVQLVKSINAQAGEVVGEPSNSALKPVFAGLSANPFFFCVVTSVIAVGDLELPFGEEAEKEEPAAVPTETIGTYEELREAFEAVEQEKEVSKGEKEKTKDGEEESFELAKKQKEAQRAEPTSSELALFDDVEVEHFAAIPAPEVEKDRTTGTLAVVTSPLKPPIVAISVNMPIHSIPSSPATASFADPELADFEAIDLDAQLDRLEQLSSIPSKAKSKAVDEAVNRNVAPRPILEISLGFARDVLNLHNRYEDLKPSFNASELCKATHEANLADYQKQKAELDMMVADYKESKIVADKLEKHIVELQKQLASLRDKQNKLGAGLGTNTKATFLVQNMVPASKPTLEIAEASLHQGMLLQQEISTKTAGLQKTIGKLGL
ncbi:unnamed protein product [Prunus armeniaca]